MTEHKDKPHEALAELLGRIGWVCRGDAQWTRLEAAMPEIAALVANPVQPSAPAQTAKVPDGWGFAEGRNGQIIVQHSSLGGCVVSDGEEIPRTIPTQILFYLASDLLCQRREQDALLSAQQAKVPEDVPSALSVLSDSMKSDPDYAWSWHCNVAMTAKDAGAPHDRANVWAANFMSRAFGVDTLTQVNAELASSLSAPATPTKVADDVVRDAKVGAAIERAARELPRYYSVEIEVEAGAATVRLYDDECCRLDHDPDGETLAGEINSAIDAALLAAQQQKESP